MKVDWLIVGAGLSGCVLAERIASQLGKGVLLIDRRDHIGGNAYDEYDRDGILIHRYGPHIFHTNDLRVWNYLSRFTEWREYEHKVLAVIDGKKVPVPFNLNTLHALFSPRQAEHLQRKLVSRYGAESKVPILKLREENDSELRSLSDFIYERVFYGYTLKQWGLTPEQLGPSVTGRVPVHISRDDRYFQDRYQGMPKHGFTAMFRRMLRHPKIKILLNADYRSLDGLVSADRVVFTGPIDQFFDHLHGHLPYRSIRFDFQHHKLDRFQNVGTENYPNGEKHTRITEFKTITGQQAYGTSVVLEYPELYRDGSNEPYYPIPSEENAELYARYQREVERLKGTVLFVGRLAEYKYFNMDQCVARALMTFEKHIAFQTDQSHDLAIATTVG